jgi:hypothetical protein
MILGAGIGRRRPGVQGTCVSVGAPWPLRDTVPRGSYTLRPLIGVWGVATG